MSGKFWSAMNSREQVRALISGGYSYNGAENYARQGVISEEAFQRFLRLWAWSTATEHGLTRGVPLERWSSRREKLRAIMRRMQGRVES